jgi:hypothetical protein
MYGPPPDPRQLTLLYTLGDDGWRYAICLIICLALSGVAMIRRLPPELRLLSFIIGQVALLTAPFAATMTEAVYGSFPTIDKSGSLLFYLDGVHQRVLLSPLDAVNDPAARLIGAHVGHLWLTALFDVVLEPFAAFNAQAMFNLCLGWWAAALWARALGASWTAAALLGAPFGMGLHVFRDLNWYTIEKSAVGWLALYAWATLNAARRGGAAWVAAASALFFVSAFMNWYWAMVEAAGLVAVTVSFAARDPRGVVLRRLVSVGLGSIVAASPLVALQLALLQGPQTLGDPERFLIERAALDSVSLWPPLWNRLELTRALSLPVILLAAWAARTRRAEAETWALITLAGALLALSLGPVILPGVPNPAYFAARAVVPGFWRIAKPEVFFEGVYLALIGLAAVACRGRDAPRWLYPIWALAWLMIVRTHPVYPGFSAPIEQRLAPDWAEHVPGLSGDPPKTP